MLEFNPVTIDDRSLFLDRDVPCCGMNCDMNFMNISSWQSRYRTEVARWRRHLVCRFAVDGQTAYMCFFDKEDIAPLLKLLIEQSAAEGHPFLLMGLCEGFMPEVEAALPGVFAYDYNRDYCDYIYKREALATLAGKKLQPKRNFVNRFRKNYPDYVFRALREEDIPACLALDEQWMRRQDASHRSDDLAERRSIEYVFRHWQALEARGGVVYVGNELVAYTYGAPISDTVFDVCVEKANPAFEGAYAIINTEFAASLPEQYALINREEDLGIEGLRKAKLSYHPEIILKKYAVRLKSQLDDDETAFMPGADGGLLPAVDNGI